MASALKPRRTEREESCFTRAARAIRRALSRICRDDSPSPSIEDTYSHSSSPRLGSAYRPPQPDPDYESSIYASGSTRPRPDPGPEDRPRRGGLKCTSLRLDWIGQRASRRQSDQDNSVYAACSKIIHSQAETRMLPPPGQKRSSSGPNLGSMKKYKMDPFGISSTTDSSGHMSDVTPGVSQDNSREMELQAAAGPSTLQFSFIKEEDDDDDGGLDFESSSSFFTPLRSQAAAQTATPPPPPPPGPRGPPSVLQDSPAGGRDAVVEMELPVTAENDRVTRTLQAPPHPLPAPPHPLPPPHPSSCRPRSHSMSSLSRLTSAEDRTFTRAESVPDMLLQTSFEDFTPDEEDGTYRVRFSCAGRYQCSVTGLVFHMEAEGDVVYTTVPWNRLLLVQHHKKPAGPLFDISCVQQSVCQLHVPHCELRSTGACDFLSVAHVKDESIDFIRPHKVTETHVVINVAGFSAFGNVKDEDSPPDPVRALVLLFYRPPADPDPESLLNVLLLPRNVVLQDVRRTRKKLVGEEIYIETSPHCKLLPKQEYTLSTSPEDDSVLVQPTEAEFDEECYDNYFPSFQVSWESVMRHMKLCLRDTKSSKTEWERRVCLSSSGGRRSCGPSALSLPAGEKLFDIRSSFIDGISGPVLKSLLDKLFEKTVMADSERESADEIPNQRDKARFVIDTVRKKGEAASSEMIEFLCEADPFLCEHLGLM